MTEAFFVSLRCPGCMAQVNVPTKDDVAKCAMCGREWSWRSHPKRVTFSGLNSADMAKVYAMQFAEVKDASPRRRYRASRR